MAPGRTCPRCREVRPKAFHWGQQYPVEIDLCPQCGGFWLDAGELLLVSEGLKAGEKLPQVKPVARPGVAHVPGAPLSPGEVLAWEVVDDLAEVAIWFGPELIQAGALAAEALPEAATAVIQAPFAIVEALPAAAEGVGLAAASVAEGIGAAAESATELLPALGDMSGALIGGIFEFLGGLE